MKLPQLHSYLYNAIKATSEGKFPRDKFSIFLWGPPGIGKTAIVEAIAAELGIPIITVIALGVPSIFGGAIITETLFKVNGIGQLLLTALFANDLPMVMTLTFIFAILIVVFNLIADVLYRVLDPRIRYD